MWLVDSEQRSAASSTVISPLRSGLSMSRTWSVGSAVVVGIAIQLPASPTANEGAADAAPRFKAVAFDSLVLFDPDSVVPRAEEVFPGKGRQLTTLWRTRQFEYTWLRSAAHRYADFSAITSDALTYSVHAMNLELTPDQERRLLDAYQNLSPWPDTINTLQLLKRYGLRVIVLSNFSSSIVRSMSEYANIINLSSTLLSNHE